MASRKTHQEIEKTFKKVSEGIASFEGIYEKITTTQNIAQRDKLEDQLKREIKKLQRFRDQIKTWAAGNEVKDKSPLLEQRKAIETCMEQFKAVEKEMKTKAYSKEGLSAASRLDPKDKEKAETCDFLSSMVDLLQQNIETMEVEEEQLQVQMKKGKKDSSKSNRLAHIQHVVERHRWHISKVELLLRLLQNGAIEPSELQDVQESIKYYADEATNEDFCGEDETIYDDLNLEEEEAVYGIGVENDHVSSQDTTSLRGEGDADAGSRDNLSRHHSHHASKKDSHPSGRASMSQSKTPLPVLSTLHMSSPQATSSTITAFVSSKSTTASTGRAGETLKYASAAAAAAATDKAGVGIAPLPPPPGAQIPPQPQPSTAPSTASIEISATSPPPSAASVVASHPPSAAPGSVNGNVAIPSMTPLRKATDELPPIKTTNPAFIAPSATSRSSTPKYEKQQDRFASVLDQEAQHRRLPQQFVQQQHPPQYAIPQQQEPPQAQSDEEESIYHLPPSLQDLLQSYEITKTRISDLTRPSTKPKGNETPSLHGQGTTSSISGASSSTMPLSGTSLTSELPMVSSDPQNSSAAADAISVQRLLHSSYNTCPDISDAERPYHYQPQMPYATPRHYPQEQLSIFSDPRLYEPGRIDTDTLFYIFYYRQGTYQQYLAARALKDQSWRFHKQYQTWFQRHEEPKVITEEYEQGTYRFFDYESTWMNRRKADFKFMYKYLEDDL